MIRKYISICALFCAISFSSWGQSASFLNVPSDIRSSALGGSSVALSANAFSFFNNSSAAAFGTAGAIGASYLMWQPDALNCNIVNLGAYFHMSEKFSITVGGKYNMIPEYDITDSKGNITGTFKPSEYIFGLGAAYAFNPNFALSVNAKYIGSEMGEDASGSSFAADLGLTYRIKSLNLGFTLANLGSKINYGDSDYSLPSVAKLGAAYTYTVKSHSITGTVEAGYLFPSDYSTFIAAIGVEYAYKDIFAIRGGYHLGGDDTIEPSYASAGASVQFYGISLGLTYLVAGSDSPIKNSMLLSLGYNF